MRNDYINISEIETHLDRVIRKKVLKHSYASTLPASLSEDVKQYVVIDCDNAIKDLHAYGSGIINIFLYAQPTANGAKNVPALSKLEKAFKKALDTDSFDSDHYSVSRELAYQDSGYDSTYNMHYIIKAIHLTII